MEILFENLQVFAFTAQLFVPSTLTMNFYRNHIRILRIFDIFKENRYESVLGLGLRETLFGFSADNFFSALGPVRNCFYTNTHTHANTIRIKNNPNIQQLSCFASHIEGLTSAVWYARVSDNNDFCLSRSPTACRVCSQFKFCVGVLVGAIWYRKVLHKLTWNEAYEGDCC